MRTWISVFLLLQIADMVTTYLGISRGLVELNQLAALAFLAGPVSTAAVYVLKGAAVSLFAIASSRGPRGIAGPFVFVLTITSSVVVANNLWRLLQ